MRLHFHLCIIGMWHRCASSDRLGPDAIRSVRHHRHVTQPVLYEQRPGRCEGRMCNSVLVHLEDAVGELAGLGAGPEQLRQEQRHGIHRAAVLHALELGDGMGAPAGPPRRRGEEHGEDGLLLSLPPGAGQRGSVGRGEAGLGRWPHLRLQGLPQGLHLVLAPPAVCRGERQQLAQRLGDEGLRLGAAGDDHLRLGGAGGHQELPAAGPGENRLGGIRHANHAADLGAAPSLVTLELAERRALRADRPAYVRVVGLGVHR
mmetsp:Transcript_30327/g.79485  ORF Transcript_30327/g.79485 Transcript_30327/m.79485 type:complete len:260 (+) Transcript_30327:512-1291(+)